MIRAGDLSRLFFKFFIIADKQFYFSSYELRIKRGLVRGGHI
jgi:hypothetical protein